MMRVAQISVTNGPFELVEREVPEPGPNAVRVAVDACGVCHSDLLTKMAAAMIGALGVEGSLLVLGAPRVPLAVPAFPLIAGVAVSRDGTRGYRSTPRTRSRSARERECGR